MTVNKINIKSWMLNLESKSKGSSKILTPLTEIAWSC